MARGFYSLVQYCPDRFRSETVNVGLILTCPNPQAMKVRMTRELARLRAYFAMGKPEIDNLKRMLEGMESRITSCVDEFRTKEDLVAFALTRANDLRLTEPRLAKIETFEADFENLFAELVETQGKSAKPKRKKNYQFPPELAAAFEKLLDQGRIWQPEPISVPLIKTELEISYAYQNGVCNYIKPQAFSENTTKAVAEASSLAVKGDLIQKNLLNGKNSRLIIVSTEETDKQAHEIDEHVGPLFKNYGVRLIRLRESKDFAQEVERSAHS